MMQRCTTVAVQTWMDTYRQVFRVVQLRVVVAFIYRSSGQAQHGTLLKMHLSPRLRVEPLQRQ